jgi:hypothetical protein
MHRSKTVDLPAHCTKFFKICNGSNGSTEIPIKNPNFCSNFAFLKVNGKWWFFINAYWYSDNKIEDKNLSDAIYFFLQKFGYFYVLCLNFEFH